MKFDKNIVESKYQKHPDNIVINKIKEIFLEAKKKFY
jgi:hypothetical protein